MQIGSNASRRPMSAGARLLIVHPSPTSTAVCVSSRGIPARGKLFATAVGGNDRACHIRTPVCTSRTKIISLKDRRGVVDIALGPGFKCLRIFSLPRRSTGICVSNALTKRAPCGDSHVPVHSCELHVRGSLFFPVSAIIGVSTKRAGKRAFAVVSAVGPGRPHHVLIVTRMNCRPSRLSCNNVVNFIHGGKTCMGFHDSFNSTSTSLRYSSDNTLASKNRNAPCCGRKIARGTHLSIATNCLQRL